jgi:SAM-dependent methyltransferase
MNPELLAYSNGRHSLVVQALCRDLLAKGISLDIHSADEMLGFFVYSQGRGLEEAVTMYLDSGRRIWETERQILAWRFGPPPWNRRLLDFASGFGRVTRHIVTDLDRENVWVSDIYAEGVAFQEQCLGVHGIVSTTEPERFVCDMTFDAILVSSLFTHLPEARFVGWLRRLGSLVAPGGLLLFSVHDLSLRRDGEGDAAAGIVFQEISESGSLETSDYGTSWVGEEFVRGAVEKAIGPYPTLRIPRGLASFQDLYIVVKEGGVTAADLLSTLRIEQEADGFLEHCSLDGKRSLRLSGWIADRVMRQPPQEVRIRIDGRDVLSCRDLQPRPDVAQTFPGDPTNVVGWQAILDVPGTAGVESAELGLHAVYPAGETRLLYSGSVAAACIRSAQLDTAILQRELTRRDAEHRQELERRETVHAGELAERQREAEALAGRLRAMEASRFWKARNLWFRFKRAAGLTIER